MINPIIDASSLHTIMTSPSPDKRASLHRGLPNRLQNRIALILPRANCLEQLNDLVPPTLSHIVDANRAHLDIVIEQKVEQGQQPIELVITRVLREIAIGSGGTI
jgi:hypothetical protein